MATEPEESGLDENGWPERVEAFVRQANAWIDDMQADGDFSLYDSYAEMMQRYPQRKMDEFKELCRPFAERRELTKLKEHLKKEVFEEDSRGIGACAADVLPLARALAILEIKTDWPGVPGARKPEPAAETGAPVSASLFDEKIPTLETEKIVAFVRDVIRLGLVQDLRLSGIDPARVRDEYPPHVLREFKKIYEAVPELQRPQLLQALTDWLARNEKDTPSYDAIKDLYPRSRRRSKTRPSKKKPGVSARDRQAELAKFERYYNFRTIKILLEKSLEADAREAREAKAADTAALVRRRNGNGR